MTKSSKGRAVHVGLIVAMLVYAALLTHGHFSLALHHDGRGLTFNSMLEHLLHGQYDVDPDIVGGEGFLRDGRVYAYWGVFLALVRLPLTLIPGGLRLDVTPLSCWIAVCIAAAVKLKTLQIVRPASAASRLRETLYGTMTAAILFSGAQIQFLQPSVYQEVCLWAGAQAAAFTFLAVRGIVAGAFSSFDLCGMAALAGLALLTRVSIGIGLSLALGLLLLTGLWREQSPGGASAMASRPFVPRLRSRAILWPALLLFLFFVAAGWVNYQRWGNPLTFADYHLYIMNGLFPDRLQRMAAYGLFNLARVPFGLGYYFFPIWVLQRRDGHLLFEEHQTRLIDATELPPGSFFLTDPLLLFLMGCMIWLVFARRRDLGIDRMRALAILCGFLAPCVLILSAISMNFRYRIEFYPLMEFGAFLGVLALCRSKLSEAAANAISRTSAALAALGIIGSAFSLLLYKVSDFGPPHLGHGVYDYYVAQFRQHFPSVLKKLLR